MQVWQVNALGGYMYADNLSTVLRTAVQPLVRFRQYCDIREAKDLGKGDTFNWNSYSDVQTEGGPLAETEDIPETNFHVTQNSLKVQEYGNSVPYTKLLDDFSEQPVTEIIHRVLKNDCRKVLDKEAWKEFKKTPLKARSSTATEYIWSETGSISGTHQNEFSKEHVKDLVDRLTERNVPTFDGTHYIAVSRPANFRNIKNNLEEIHKYTVPGWNSIMNGEKGRFEGVRFIEQTSIPRASPANANSDDIFIFGSDTVIEAMTVPEEIRGRIPTKFGRDRAIAWYAILGYGICHTDADQARVVHWTDSASA